MTILPNDHEMEVETEDFHHILSWLMRLESEVALSLSLASSSGPSETPARRVDPFEPMLHGKLRNTSAAMPHQP